MFITKKMYRAGYWFTWVYDKMWTELSDTSQSTAVIYHSLMPAQQANILNRDLHIPLFSL